MLRPRSRPDSHPRGNDLEVGMKERGMSNNCKELDSGSSPG